MPVKPGMECLQWVGLQNQKVCTPPPGRPPPLSPSLRPPGNCRYKSPLLRPLDGPRAGARAAPQHSPVRESQNHLAPGFISHVTA